MDAKIPDDRSEALSGLVGESVLTLVAISIQVGLIMATQALVARGLGPSGIGVLSLLLTVPTLIVGASNMGMMLSNTYFAASEPVLRPALASLSLFMSIILGVGYAVVLFGARSLMPAWFSDAPASLFPAMLIGLPALYLLSCYSSLILGMRLVLKYNLLASVRMIGLFAMAAALAATHNLTAHLLPVVWLGGILLGLAFSLLWTLKPIGVLVEPDWKLFARSFRYGVKGDIANLLTQFNYRAGLFCITWLLGLTNAGIYMAAVSVSEAVGYIGSAVATVLTPRIASSDQPNALTPVICRMVLLVMVVATTLIGIAASWIIGIVYGPEFSSATALLRWMLPGIIALTGARILSADLMGRGKSGYALLTSMAGAVTTLLSLLILVPLYGVLGAAIGSTCVYGLLFLLSLFWYSREASLPAHHWGSVVLLQPGDWQIMRNVIYSFAFSQRGQRR